jgi:hypothetical protein
VDSDNETPTYGLLVEPKISADQPTMRLLLFAGSQSRLNERLVTWDLPRGKNCTNLIHELPSLTYDPNGGEDIDQNCASDHCFDCLRYALTKKAVWTRVAKVRFAH